MQVNYGAVIVAAIVNMVIGFIWYSPGVFGKTWMSLMGKRMEDMKSRAEMQRSMRSAYAGAFVAALITAWILARFINLANAQTMTRGAVIGFWAWLGFIATTTLGDVLFGGRPIKLYYLTNGYYLVSLIIMGALLGTWR